MSVDIEWKYNNTNVETNDYKYGYKNRNHSFFMEHFKKDQSVETKTSHKIQTHNGNQRREITRKRRVKSKISTVLSYKRRSNKTSGVDTADTRTENKSMCTFSFDKKSLLEARKNLTKPYYLFYINLTINNIDSLTIDTKEQDNLMQWQYVKKSEEFLVQLPVDFDLLTYNLLVIDKEETVLNIPVEYNHSICSQEKQEQRVSSIRLSLWNELFENNTNYSLCNRDFNSSHRREFLYMIATIWVGYDLNCSMISSEGGFMNYSIEKDHLPLVTPFFCFFLSLQFVWIFALLDLKPDFDSDSSTNDSNENEIKIDPCSVHFKTNQKWFYNERDRPYGIKRLVVKTLFGNCGSQCTCKSCQIDIQPGLRLLCLLWFFIFLPFGLYRTIGRKTLLGHMYNNYLNVVRPSEPMFELICENAKDKDVCNFSLDIVYATVFPFVYIILGYISYKIFLTNHFKTCCCFPEINEDEGVIRKSKGVSDRFAFRYYQLCTILSTGCCNSERLKCDCYNCCKDNCCDCCASNCCSKRKCCDKCCRCFVLCCTFILGFIYCLLPIFPFTCCTHIACYYCPLCKCCGLKNNNGKGNNNQDIEENIDTANYNPNYEDELEETRGNFAVSEGSENNSNLQIERADTENRNNKKGSCVSYIMCLVLQVFRIPVTYLFLRPIISTFTFLFRSFTFFFFVALPIRAHILRYTMLIVTTVAYFAKYFHEIVNMNTEILKYLIKCQEKKTKLIQVSTPKKAKVSTAKKAKLSTTKKVNVSTAKKVKVSIARKAKVSTTKKAKQTADKLDEEIFDYVYQRLMFVRKNVYFMFLKMIVVAMYLIITIETFVTNKSSLTGSSFKDILEFLLIIIGPYAISLFLKVNKEDFLTVENKTEIENEYNNICDKLKSDEIHENERNSSSQDQVDDETKIYHCFSCHYFVLFDEKKEHEMQNAYTIIV